MLTLNFYNENVMPGFFHKLLLGSYSKRDGLPQYAIRKRMRNIKAIWNNEYDNDGGLEKIIRLFLAISPFFFAGIYIKEIFGKKGLAIQELATDVFVIFKVIFPILILKFGWNHEPFVIGILIWFMAETLLYAPTLIFASDIFGRPRSYRRSMLLIFFNYLEITFAFAVIYTTGAYLNRPFMHWFDAVYFSFITSATIGFGDLHPVTLTGKFLVSGQTTIFFIFIVIFLNFFSSKVEHKGYMDQNRND